MGVILHQNSRGVKMIREDFKKRSQVKVVSEYKGKRYCLRTYRFDFTQETFDSPFISWANLDCCGGWSYDEDYLTTAVQEGRKLFASIATPLSVQHPDFPSEETVRQQFESFRSTLHPDIFADYDRDPVFFDHLHTFICRQGRIADYIELEAVFSFYEKLGIIIPDSMKEKVERYCDCEIKTFGTSSAPFDYSNAGTGIELITAGLLLGYPIESTASILQGY